LVGSESGKGGEDNVMEKIRGALRVLLASSIVQCCEAIEDALVHRR